MILHNPDCVWKGFYSSPSNSKIIKPSINLQFYLQFYCIYYFLPFSSSPWTHRPSLPSCLYTVFYFQKLHPVCQAVCTLNTPLHTHTQTHHHHRLRLIPSLVCGMPTSRGCPPVLGWHRLQGPGHIWSLREGEPRGAPRARGKLETVMNRTIAGGRTDTEGLCEQRMCPSKQSYLWSRTQGRTRGGGTVGGWRAERKGKQTEWV